MFAISVVFHYLLHLTALVLIVFSYWRFGFWNGLRDTLLIGFVWWLLTWVTTTLTVTLVRMLDPTFDPENMEV